MYHASLVVVLADHEPAAEENEVAGYDENLARSIHLLDSAEKAPRVQGLHNFLHMIPSVFSCNLFA